LPNPRSRTSWNTLGVGQCDDFESLGHRGEDVKHLGEVFDFGPEAQAHNSLMDDLSRIQTVHRDTKNFPGVCVRDHLDDARCIAHGSSARTSDIGIVRQAHW